jgi:hypothetical protein
MYLTLANIFLFKKKNTACEAAVRPRNGGLLVTSGLNDVETRTIVIFLGLSELTWNIDGRELGEMGWGVGCGGA